MDQGNLPDSQNPPIPSFQPEPRPPTPSETPPIMSQTQLEAKRPTSLTIVLIFWFLMALFGSLMFIYLLLGTIFGFVSAGRPLILNVSLSVIILLIFVYLLKISIDLWKGKKSGLTPIKVFSILNLLNFPVGTILSISTFQVLRKTEVKNFFDTT